MPFLAQSGGGQSTLASDLQARFAGNWAGVVVVGGATYFGAASAALAEHQRGDDDGQQREVLSFHGWCGCGVGWAPVRIRRIQPLSLS